MFKKIYIYIVFFFNFINKKNKNNKNELIFTAIKIARK